ncbi:zinc finger, CCHC-type containing protein [Tanacetum coccineum]
MDESMFVSSVIDKLPLSLKEFKHTLKHGKDDLSLVQLGSHLRIEESLRVQKSDKGKGKEVAGPSVNMTEEGGKNKNNKQNKEKKRGFKDNNGASGSNKKLKLECCKCGKTGHFKRDCRSGNKKNNASAGGSGNGSKDQSQDQGFGYYNNGMFILNLNKVLDDFGSVCMSSSTVVNSLLWHARLGHVHYKRMLEMSKDDLILAIDENTEKCNKKYVITFIDDATRFCYVYLLHAKDEALDKFRIYKTEVELQQNDLIKTLRTDRGDEYYDPIFFQYVGIIQETTAPYTLAVVRLPDPKRKTLGEKGIDYIFVGYVGQSKAYRFYVIEPSDSVSINTIIESRDAIFDENRFSSIPRPKDVIPNSNKSQKDDHSNDVPSETPEPRKGKRVRKAKSYGYDFQLYLVERSRDQIGSQYSYRYSIEDDP